MKAVLLLLLTVSLPIDRMALHPSGRSLAFAMGQGGLKCLDLDLKAAVPHADQTTGNEPRLPACPQAGILTVPLLPASMQDKLASVKGDIKCMAFHPAGNYLGLGFSDGSLKVYEWPSLHIKMNLRCAGSSCLPGPCPLLISHGQS